jgi:hypothetical protein
MLLFCCAAFEVFASRCVAQFNRGKVRARAGFQLKKDVIALSQ